MTELDTRIMIALNSLGHTSQFDKASYIEQFASSAAEKAQTVIQQLDDEEAPFKNLRPVFVSVGGGDGTELQALLAGTTARLGLLIEKTIELIDLAREKNLGEKSIEFYHGDAVQQLSSAMERARKYVKEGYADYVVVTCHAVLHELFDRGAEKFIPLSFFADIFGDQYAPSTWFTYREPGVPEKWPESVLLQANCAPSNLLRLAELICQRHAALSELKPKPQVVGDHVFLHRTLAMETLAKLFYLSDLAYEIQERSTSVNHQELMSAALIAIGETAAKEDRGNVRSLSEATKSFARYWREYGVHVRGFSSAGSADLPIAESQTRVIAWRKMSDSATDGRTSDQGESPMRQTSMGAELDMARSALKTGDDAMLIALLSSRARSWIESNSLPETLELVKEIRKSRPERDLTHLWGAYIYNIARLFSGNSISPEVFSGSAAAHASSQGLGLLYEAEFMEFNRKCQFFDVAISTANRILIELRRVPHNPSSDQRYSLGTANYLMANLLRHGGQYGQALLFITAAESFYTRGIPSHDTELAHCTYAKSVCALMTGTIAVAPETGANRSPGQAFADALISLTYSHAAWFTGDVQEAKKFAKAAHESFQGNGFDHYAKRARNLLSLLSAWACLEAGKPLTELTNTTIREVVNLITNKSADLSQLERYSRLLKPSLFIGLLQFGKTFTRRWEETTAIPLPDRWTIDAGGNIQRLPDSSATSLSDANAKLREFMGIPQDRRVPLLAD